MNARNDIPKTELNCAECVADIPLDAGLTPSGMEYLQYFCGLDCLDGFLGRARATANADVMLASQRILG